MIIDIHTRIWASLDQLGAEGAAASRRRESHQWRHIDASPGAHERGMGTVDAAAVFGFQSDLLGASIPSEYIAEFVAKKPQQRFGIAGVDPMSEAVDEQIDKAVSFGMAGLTVSPMCQGFHPTHSRAMRIYEKSLEHNLPLFVTPGEPLTSSAVMEFGRPSLWDEVARSFPDLPLVIIGLGHPWIDETLTLLGKHRNVYADISGVTTRPWQLYNALLNAVSLDVMDRLLFGSGFPHEMPAKAIEALYKVNSIGQATQLPSIPRSRIRGIIERNTLECLGIDIDLVETSDELEPEVVINHNTLQPKQEAVTSEGSAHSKE